MARTRNVKVETPGAPSAPDTDGTPQLPPETPVSAAQVSASPEAQEKAAKDAELAKQVEATRSLVGNTAALDWSHLNSPATLAPKLANAEADLPNDADVDPFKIPFGQKVLTRQGWVLSTVPDPRDRRA